jgi:hypothetical protein
MSRGRPYTPQQLTQYHKEIQAIINLKPGEFFVVDNYCLKSLRVMLNRFLRKYFEGDHINYRSMIVSKDKAYFFRVDHSFNLEDSKNDNRI